MIYRKILGIDIGGSGVKGAIVNTRTGELKTDRYRVPTPVPATPANVADVIKEIAAHFKWNGPIGAGYPGVVLNGVVKTAANVDRSWIGMNAEEYLQKKTGYPFYILNDADAAGFAEMKFGAGKGNKGLVMLITVGTGVGVVFFTRGKLMANCEMGHVIMPHGEEAEKYISDATNKELNLDWNVWMKRIDEYLQYMHSLFWPDLIIIGGGLSKKLDAKKMPFHLPVKVVPAQLLNEAGIIGAAIAARKMKFKMLETKN
ncbi:MAG TPA: ROK family protein [Bacteroidales bacterium]|nr:ROK family protein [Bacteroidales bacterium]